VYTHKKQIGGAGQYASYWIHRADEALEKGTSSGNPITGCRLALEDGAFHAVDSSKLAFRLASSKVRTWKRPLFFFFSVFARMRSDHIIFFTWPSYRRVARKGTIVDSEVRDDEFTAPAEVTLNEMFGYLNQLRGSTQGKGAFSMEYKVILSLSSFSESFVYSFSFYFSSLLEPNASTSERAEGAGGRVSPDFDMYIRELCNDPLLVAVVTVLTGSDDGGTDTGSTM
jgi:hypothetical protein